MEKGTEILLRTIVKAIVETDQRAGVRSPLIQNLYQLAEDGLFAGDPVTAKEIGMMADFARDVANSLQYSN